MQQKTVDKMKNYLKENGFFFQSGGIYKDLSKSWDLGPTGQGLKKNLEKIWSNYFISYSTENVICDTAIMTSAQTLESSGHLKNFYDWFVECPINSCRKRYRLDVFLETKEFNEFLKANKVEKFTGKCLFCQKTIVVEPSRLNLLLKTNLEINEGKIEKNVYLRPETCQGIFVNFLNIQKSMQKKIPFGIGQIGKSFRNEITLNHWVFRVREFTQMEFEFFCWTEDKEKWWDYWMKKSWSFFNKILFQEGKEIKKIYLEKEELPHYAKKTLDFYFKFSFGWGEVCSNSDRGDYDLKNHSEKSGKTLGFSEREQEVFPSVIEVSFGVERLMLAILENAYREENGLKKRNYLKLHPLLSPYFAAITFLDRKLKERAKEIFLQIRKNLLFDLYFSEATSIGKSYRKQDMIGTYICLTVDFDTVDDKKVTCRNRDTREQERIEIENLENYLNQIYKSFANNFYD